jgi:hypothetical protein
MDYTFATGYPDIKFSNDATSCFDQIIPSVSSMVVVRFAPQHRPNAWKHAAKCGNLPHQDSAWYF